MARPKKSNTKTKKSIVKSKVIAKKGKKKPAKVVSKTKKITKKKVKKVSPIPKDTHNITPYLIVKQADKAIDFYVKVFGAKQVKRMEHTDGSIMHAQLKIGNSKIMLSDEHPAMKTAGPEAFGGTPVSIYLYVKNVDVVVDKALAAGAKLTYPVEDMFYGDRSGTIEDPFGHKWHVSTHIEDVTPAALKKRAALLFKQ